MIKTRPILLAEDSEDDVLLIRRALAKAGVERPVFAVNDGDAAQLYLAGKAPYADRDANPLPILVLLDLKLPRRSGHELIHWVRSQPGLRRLPLVVLSTSAQREDVDLAYELGANSYHCKPHDFDRLARLLASVVTYWLEWSEHPAIGP